jgi:N-acylneuraminate cytidylyltransferase/CMP-N,N'-diacetyllegionaminic acid synthase
MTDIVATGEVLALIPVRGRDLVKSGGMPTLGDRPLMAYTVEAARKARTVGRVVVSTDSEDVRKLAVDLGAEAPFLRPAELSAPGTPLEAALRHALVMLERDPGYRPRIVVRLEISHPFRETGLIDRVVRTLVEQDLDTVFTAFEDHHNFWKVNEAGELEPLTDGGQTRAQRPPIYKEVGGLVCAMRADVVRAGQRLGERVGVVALSSLQALVDTQDEAGLELARRVL